MLDLSKLDARPIVANLKPLCRPKTLNTSYMLMQQARPQESHGTYAAVHQSLPASVVTCGFVWEPRYAEQQNWTLQRMAEESQGLRQCVGVQYSFFFQFSSRTQNGEYHPYRVHVERMLLPTNAIRDASDDFLKRNELFSRPFAAMHLRLTDIGAIKSAKGLDCSVDVRAFVDKIKSYGDMPVALATDNEKSNCTRVVIESLPVTLVKSGIWDPSSCMEAAFVQEVMGHASAFVGVRKSTFSMEIESIRTARHRHRHLGHMFGV